MWPGCVRLVRSVEGRLPMKSRNTDRGTATPPTFTLDAGSAAVPPAGHAHTHAAQPRKVRKCCVIAARVLPGAVDAGDMPTARAERARLPAQGSQTHSPPRMPTHTLKTTPTHAVPQRMHTQGTPGPYPEWCLPPCPRPSLWVATPPVAHPAGRRTGMHRLAPGMTTPRQRLPGRHR